MLVGCLAARGYAVLSARNGREALVLLSSAVPIDLLLTDVTMPEMDGLALAREASTIRPSLIVRFMSGFVASLSALSAIQARLIPKLVQMDILCGEIARALATPL